MTKQFASVLLMAALAFACTPAGQPAADQQPPPQEGATPGAAPAAGGVSPPATDLSRSAAPQAPAAPSQPAVAAPAASAVGTAPAPKPEFKEVTIPSGTTLRVTLDTPVASDTSRVEDPVQGRLARAIVIGGVTVVPAGSVVTGSVTEAVRSAKVKGRASIALRFHSFTARDERHDIQTARIARRAPATKAEDAGKVGIGAGAGALIGAIAGGGKGAAIGGAVGAGAGTGVVVATRGEEVRLGAGATVSTTLQEPVTVLVPLK